MNRLEYKSAFALQPPEYSSKLPDFRFFKEKTIVVLDDDPTGCQTVQNIPLLTEWEYPQIKKKFREKEPLFFILTNTRSMVATEAVRLIREITSNLQTASIETGREFLVISRSDSTLRGHFPEETDAIIENLQMKEALLCLIPAFFQGGRFTLNDIHYVQDGDYLIPAAETQYARDRVFGFSSSNLAGYIIEKSGGKIGGDRIHSFSLSDLRIKGPIYVKEKLLEKKYTTCFVNAISQTDLDVFAQGARMAIEEGRQIVFRSAASFINSIGNLPLGRLLQKDDLNISGKQGSLFIVGSYIDKSSLQLNHLLKQDGIIPVRIDVEKLLLENEDKYVMEMVRKISSGLEKAQNLVLYTSRKLITGNSDEDNLKIGGVVARTLAAIVKNISSAPAFILTKGGITSHIVARQGLEIRESLVIGQILPGVPVWKIREGGKFRELPFIIFPGNVGTETSLTEIYHKLT